MNASVNEFCATGRRKTASARVRIVSGSGKIKVNGKGFEEYFTTEATRGYILQPLALTGLTSSLDIVANIVGGGIAGQAGKIIKRINRTGEALALLCRSYWVWNRLLARSRWRAMLMSSWLS